jgi:hypothetical protein
MPYKNDKVSDVLSILEIIRSECKRQFSYYNITELRKEAVKDMAKNELRQKRYKNKNSAEKSIHDACARRLKPDVDNIKDFDRLIDKWLQQNSMRLKDILIKHIGSRSQRFIVSEFFGNEV